MPPRTRTTPRDRPRRIHHAWWILASAFLTLTITNGLTLSALSVFDEHLIETFGWSRAALKLRTLITFAVAGLAAPVAGLLVDRFGVRRLLLGGVVLLSAALLAYTRIRTPWHVYLVHAALGVSLACAGLVVNVILVSRWFAARRGTAIGLALVGTSLGNALFPQCIQALLAFATWRGAFLWLGLCPLLLLPVHLLVVREWPQEMRLSPLGAASPTGAAPAGAASPTGPGLSYREALRDRDFWALAVTAMITFYSMLATADHLFLHLRGLGHAPAAAAQRLSLLFLLGLVGKALLGILADRFEPRRVLLGGIASMTVGAWCLSTLQPGLVWPFLLCFGIGWGGLYTMIQLLAIQRFGLRASGRILGTITILDAIGGGLGPWVTGLLYDLEGSYRLPFLAMTLLLLAALATAATVRPVRTAPP
jgi:MFS family permease